MEAVGSRGLSSAWLVLALVLVPAAGLAGCVTEQQGAQLAADVAGCRDAAAAETREGGFGYAGAVSCKSATESYEWNNPSAIAEIEFGSGIVTGELSIRVLDAQGRTVFEGEASAASQGEQTRSSPGVPTGPLTGPWTVELTFENVTGTLGLKVTASPRPPA